MNANESDDASLFDSSASDAFSRSKASPIMKYIKSIVWVVTLVSIVVLYFQYDMLKGQNTMAKQWIELEMIAMFFEFPFFMCLFKVMLWRQQKIID